MPDFDAITVRATGAPGLIITDVAVTVPLDADHASGTHIEVVARALWDTGASKSMISQEIVKGLALVSNGTARKLFHAGGFEDSQPTYLVNLRLPNNVRFERITAAGFPGSGGAFDVIIGMDILARGDFSLSFVGGETCMSFRTPSIAEIDYVKEYNRQLVAGLGRNDKCRCGSGKKVKDCHGA